MIQLRGSLGSERSLPVPKPSDAFHLFMASSSASVEHEISYGVPHRFIEVERRRNYRSLGEQFDVIKDHFLVVLRRHCHE